MGRPISLARTAAGLAALACALTAAPVAAADDPNAPWPTSPTDIRSVHRGGRITPHASDGEAVDGKTKASSPAFTHTVTLFGEKAVLAATATIRCDIKPGVYPIYLHNSMLEPNEVFARLRVKPDGKSTPKACREQQQAANASAGDGKGSNQALIVGGGAAGLVAAGAGGFLLAKRRRLRDVNAA